jgi:hypothetical protein
MIMSQLSATKCYATTMRRGEPQELAGFAKCEDLSKRFSSRGRFAFQEVSFSVPKAPSRRSSAPRAAASTLLHIMADADIFLVLHVFDPQGNEIVFSGAQHPRTPISQGWLRASHRALDRERSGYRIGLSVRGTDYDYGETALAAANLAVHTASKEKKRGPGAFMHDDLRDRPPEIYGGTVTLHTGGSCESYVPLPVIPAR